MPNLPITLALTGASGAPYALRFLEIATQAGHEIYLLVSEAARQVLHLEHDMALPKRPRDIQIFFENKFNIPAGKLTVFGEQQWTAPIASGAARTAAMLVCPCTTGCLAAIADGHSNNLIERAADVMIKEQRKLILVVRESPLSAIHLAHMLKLAQLGVTIMPPMPGFYHRPQSVDDLVDFTVARLLDHVGIEHNIMPIWGADKRAQ